MVSGSGFCDLGFAKLDMDRKKRRGFPEVIYCPGKTNDQIKKIARQFIKDRQDLLLTKLDKNVFKGIKQGIPRLKYNPVAKLGYLILQPKVIKKGLVLVISAGTSDIPVAEEAAVTLEVMSNRVIRLYDVGVAGVHRLLSSMNIIKKANAIVVVAGMEGALASVVSGLTSAPVVAVPTSSGYGASFSGLSALLTMLNSCSPGVAVVNIDNGFGAGYFASIVNR